MHGGPGAGTEGAPGTLTAPARRVADGAWRASRIVVFVFVLVGATLLPLALEVAWRGEGHPSQHVQPEVVVIEQAADRLAHGEDPYHAVVADGHVVSAVPGEPTYESFFPYLPLMAVFGLPGSTHEPVRLTDARIFFSVVTLLVVAGALALCRGPSGRQVPHPPGAHGPAHGGPAVGHRGRRHADRGLPAAGHGAGPAAPPGVERLRARDRLGHEVHRLAAGRPGPVRRPRPEGRRAPGRMALGMLVVAGPVVVPFVLRNPHAFVVNVVLFPLGLAGVASPAASPCRATCW